jgi:hypothetical protein
MALVPFGAKIEEARLSRSKLRGRFIGSTDKICSKSHHWAKTAAGQSLAAGMPDFLRYSVGSGADHKLARISETATMTITQGASRARSDTNIDTPKARFRSERLAGLPSCFSCSAEALTRFTDPPLRTRAIVDGVTPRNTRAGGVLGRHKRTRIYKGKRARLELNLLNFPTTHGGRGSRKQRTSKRRRPAGIRLENHV